MSFIPSRSTHYFAAEQFEEFRSILEGNSTDDDSTNNSLMGVVIDTYDFDEQFCMEAYFDRRARKRSLPVCVNPTNMILAIVFGLVIDLTLVFAMRPGPVLILFCVLLISGLLPGLSTLWRFAAYKECGNNTEVCLPEQMYIISRLCYVKLAIWQKFF